MRSRLEWHDSPTTESAWRVVVGGDGLRTPEDLLELFETIVNLVREQCPNAAIAFNTAADDTFDAAYRGVDLGPV